MEASIWTGLGYDTAHTVTLTVTADGQKAVLQTSVTTPSNYAYVVKYRFNPKGDYQSTLGMWIAKFQNTRMPDGVESITAENGHIVWKCKDGYAVTKFVANLPPNSRIALDDPRAMDGTKKANLYPSFVDVGDGTVIIDTSTAIHNGGDLGPIIGNKRYAEYGVNCFKI